jgi:5-(carboxyamino)imidazole ribonucleotide synthase
MVARGVDGTVSVYPLVTTVQRDGMCSEVQFPTDLEPALVAEADALTLRIAELVDLVGVMAVEYFVTPTGLVINELALRPHNSGHWTIEGCATSQFANHLLAVSGHSLGDATPVVPCAVMVNVVGAEQPGSLARAIEVAQAHVHDYGKSWRPQRKLGHVTVVGNDLDHARSIAWASAHAYGTSTQENP